MQCTDHHNACKCREDKVKRLAKAALSTVIAYDNVDTAKSHNEYFKNILEAAISNLNRAIDDIEIAK